eukprot:784861-Rhodomonas_salina.3
MRQAEELVKLHLMFPDNLAPEGQPMTSEKEELTLKEALEAQDKEPYEMLEKPQEPVAAGKLEETEAEGWQDPSAVQPWDDTPVLDGFVGEDE